jgi:hypothetical protein
MVEVRRRLEGCSPDVSVGFTRKNWNQSSMIYRLNTWFKHVLTLVGAAMSNRRHVQVQAVVNYLKVGRWMRDNGFVFSTKANCRQDVWDAILCRVESERVLYLEFGVAYGESIRYWSRNLKHPDTILHGFDSFEGMPESSGIWKKGQFDASGKIPGMGDPRVTFFKGWFDKVLPHYTLVPMDRLIINMDADLYSSTSYVLNFLLPFIRPGTIIYFDEMNHVEHEPRAFREIMNRGLTFKPLAADKTLAHVSFECVSVPDI